MRGLLPLRRLHFAGEGVNLTLEYEFINLRYSSQFLTIPPSCRIAHYFLAVAMGEKKGVVPLGEGDVVLEGQGDVVLKEEVEVASGV